MFSDADADDVAVVANDDDDVAIAGSFFLSRHQSGGEMCSDLIHLRECAICSHMREEIETLKALANFKVYPHPHIYS